MKIYFLCLVLCALLANSDPHPTPFKDGTIYNIGIGIYDITGPAAEEGMMGYAMANQVSKGIHIRQRSRAFIVADDKKRFVFVNNDACMAFIGNYLKVVERLKPRFGDLYNEKNIIITGTHTHSGPGGFAYELLYDISTFGFNKMNFDTIVDGIVEAITRAHMNLQPGNIKYSQGDLFNSNINRSPTSYLANPASERSLYHGDVDTIMTQLRFEDTHGKELGALNWFAVHGTSMYHNNTYISGDNKGAAAYFFEKFKNGNESLPGFGPFISAFAQSNEGDVSPNTRGAFCDDGTRCDNPKSGCSKGWCNGRGPGNTDEESCYIIAQNQFKRGVELYDQATTPLMGVVDYRHSYVDMTKFKVDPKFADGVKNATTCTGALGDAFAAGTTDGPGLFDFKQGSNSTKDNPYWNFIGAFLSKPTKEQILCHHPKPILLNVGDIHLGPAPWVDAIVPVSIARVGKLFIIAVPGEFTTMAGRRLRNTIRQAMRDAKYTDAESAVITIAGLSNAYTHYITTHEEYTYQRYEAASTLYGPWTLAAYQEIYYNLTYALMTGAPVEHGPIPPDLEGKQISFGSGVIGDGGSFGKIQTDAKPSYKVGETVSCVFYSAHPKNDHLIQSSFLNVERLHEGEWIIVRTDGDWSTKFNWKRHLVDQSLVTITWNIESWASPGLYRIQHFGNHKNFFTKKISPFSGMTRTFTVSA